MAPIQHLGNIDKRKRTSQQVAFGFFSFLSYLVVVILFVILDLWIIGYKIFCNTKLRLARISCIQ